MDLLRLVGLDLFSLLTARLLRPFLESEGVALFVGPGRTDRGKSFGPVSRPPSCSATPGETLMRGSLLLPLFSDDDLAILRGLEPEGLVPLSCRGLYYTVYVWQIDDRWRCMIGGCCL
jgi:hypothetical protein